MNFFTKNNINFSNVKGIVVEGIVVSITEYLTLGAFVLVNFIINFYYGTEVVGVYFLAYSIAQIGIVGIGSTFSLLMRRDLSINQYDSNEYLSKVQLLRFGNLLIVLLLSTVFIGFFYQPLRSNLSFILIMIAAKGFDSLSESYYTAYQSLGRINDYGFFKNLNAVVFFLVSVLICSGRYDIEYLYWSQLICAVVIFTINFFRWRKTKTIPSNIEVKTLQNITYRLLVIESFPLIINSLIFQISLRANNILIFDSIGERNLGIYSLVFITITAFTGIANPLAVVFFGRLSRVFVNTPDLFSKRLHQAIVLFLVTGIVFLLGYLVFIPMVEYFFVIGINPDLYRIMSAVIPFMFVTSCLGAVFTIVKRQIIGMYISVIVLIFNLLAYYFLLAQFGLIGAGYAFLASIIFQSLLIYFGVVIALKFKPEIISK